MAGRHSFKDDRAVWSTKIAPNGYLMLEIPPNRTSETLRVFIKAGVAPGGDGKMLTLGIDAPREHVQIVRDPTAEQKRHYPDRGASIGESLAAVERWERRKQEEIDTGSRSERPHRLARKSG